MELTEPVDSINKQLKELFGIDTISGLSMWRVVFSEDQIEKRLGTYSDFTSSGLFVRTVTEVREVPKYRQWIQEKYVLERLTIIPVINADELPTSQMSYEPMWVFEDKNGKYLPPRLDAAKVIIDTVYAAQYGDHNLRKYVDKDNSHEAAEDNRMKRVLEIENQLFGDESGLKQSTLAGGTAIIVPQNFKKVSDV